MKMFGTAVNDEFSDVEETGILVGFNEMYADKRDRHKEPYMAHLMQLMRERFPLLKDGFAEKFALRKDSRRDKIMRKIKKEKVEP